LIAAAAVTLAALRHPAQHLAGANFRPQANFGRELEQLAILRLLGIHLHRERFIADRLDLVDAAGVGQRPARRFVFNQSNRHDSSRVGACAPSFRG
jgi:hypothetical protein